MNFEKSFNENGRGEQARLFPILSESSKEGRAASIFLACLRAVPKFADAILNPIGRPIGKRSSVQCRTEIVFKSNPKLRPDGLISVNSGRTMWNALLEFKVAGTLTTEQVEDYLRLAKENSVNAVITISNDLVPDPKSCPVKVDRRLTRSIELYHFSWMHIFTQAELLLSEKQIFSTEQRYIIEEFARFLAHSSAGIKGYVAMPASWSDVVERVRTGTRFSKSDNMVTEIVDGWIQEERELSLIMSRQTSTNCSVKRKRSVSNSIDLIREAHCVDLVNSGILKTEITIPAAASPLEVCCNLESRSIITSMNIKAPRDKKRATATITWLLRQLPAETAFDPTVRALWPSRALPTQATLSELRESPECLVADRTGMLPHSFDIFIRLELKDRFTSRKQIISTLEKSVGDFYRNVGSLLVSWVPQPPKSRDTSTVEEIVMESSFGEENKDAFNPSLE